MKNEKNLITNFNGKYFSVVSFYFLLSLSGGNKKRGGLHLFRNYFHFYIYFYELQKSAINLNYGCYKKMYFIFFYSSGEK